ncbi:Chitin synthase 4 [Pleosporales sp. CAS-2024a]
MATVASAPPNGALPSLPPAHSANEADSNRPERTTQFLRQEPMMSDVAQQPSIPSFSINEQEDARTGSRDSRLSERSLSPSSAGHSRTPSRDTPDFGKHRDSCISIAVTRDIPIRQMHISNGSHASRHSHAAEMDVATMHRDPEAVYSPRAHEQYKQPTPPPPVARLPRDSIGPDWQHYSYQNNARSAAFNSGADSPLQARRSPLARPSSAYAMGSGLDPRSSTTSPRLSVGGSPASSNGYARQASSSRRSPDLRPTSYIDLVNLPYNQQIAPAANLGNAQLRTAVGQNASLLDTKKTLEMYRANVNKTQESAVQYEFALFMVQVAREVMAAGPSTDNHGLAPVHMLREARQILQKLADRSYPFAQYYLADGYASGLFNKDRPDYDRAFPLFVAASKHGHAESGYRTALCYEFGWGCRKDYAKAVQFFRAAASKGHPGAAIRLGKACLTGDMGLQGKYREGVKWLKRATESADFQYNSAPYELGLLHETGYGDDIFKDEIYAAQLFTQAAELGHPWAALKLGDAYEHGLLCCPKDAALSVHYYNTAAQADIPEAMMNLCAWYMVGAEPVLEKDENEAYEWAKKAAEHGEYIVEKPRVRLLLITTPALPKAEYACGYFTEMGIGCRRDPLEANVWYVKAADHGDERAKQRLAIIQAAASGQSHLPPSTGNAKSKLKKGSKEESCSVM